MAASVAAPSREERYVRVRGRDIRVVVRGREHGGTPLLLLTGIGAHVEMWEPLADHIGGDRCLIGVDVPGTGASDRPPVPLWMTDFARLLPEVLDELGFLRVDVLGYSWGGALAQQLAYDEPALVRRLVLCATTPGWGSLPPRPVAGTLLLSPARYLHPTLMRLTLPLIAGGKTRREPEVQLAKQAENRLAHKPDPIGYAGQLYAISGWTSLPWLHKLRQPTLVIAGDDDPVIPVCNARMMASRIPDGELFVVRGGGHLFLLDEPESVAPAIDAFLSR